MQDSTQSTRDERGATATEYALMITLIAFAIIGAVTLFGTEAANLFKVPADVFTGKGP